MLKTFFNGIKSIFTKPTKVTMESVAFIREESIKDDIAILHLTVSSTKEVIALLETTLKAKTYQILAGGTVEKEDTVYQMSSNFAHTPAKNNVRVVN